MTARPSERNSSWDSLTQHARRSAIVVILLASPCLCQQASPSATLPQTESKRLFGLIPNYRTSPDLAHSKPLSEKEKFKMASEDVFDRGTIGLVALFGARAQLTNSNRAFGQGAAGYARYTGAAYGDLLLGDYMTESVIPTLLHQDPRYFRRRTGSEWSRFGYAVGQIFMTHRDSGRNQFNYSEVAGNAIAVAISNAYYADNRTARDNMSKLGIQLGVDMASNVLKEFWPDLQHKFRRKHTRAARLGSPIELERFKDTHDGTAHSQNKRSK
jgi:hypothetical protein